jgi:hypothetical protein
MAFLANFRGKEIIWKDMFKFGTAKRRYLKICGKLWKSRTK